MVVLNISLQEKQKLRTGLLALLLGTRTQLGTLWAAELSSCLSPGRETSLRLRSDSGPTSLLFGRSPRTGGVPVGGRREATHLDREARGVGQPWLRHPWLRQRVESGVGGPFGGRCKDTAWQVIEGRTFVSQKHPLAKRPKLTANSLEVTFFLAPEWGDSASIFDYRM